MTARLDAGSNTGFAEEMNAGNAFRNAGNGIVDAGIDNQLPRE